MRVVIRLLGMCIALAASAAVPSVINFQGTITDPDGTPLDTTVEIGFRIYAEYYSETPVWDEFHTVTTVNGHYDAALGGADPIPQEFFDDGSMWLGITVGSDAEMSPRMNFMAVPYAFRIGTVDEASGGTIWGKLNVGAENTNNGEFSNVFGFDLNATGNYSVSMGRNNTVNSDYSSAAGRDHLVTGNCATVGGGATNSASGLYSTISGGSNNTAEAGYATIGGGRNNFAILDDATVGGGNSNVANNYYATVSGGGNNYASGEFSVVGGGGGDDTTESNSARGNFSVIGGGYHNDANGDASTIAGGYYHAATGNSATVGGGYRNSSTNFYSTVGGGTYNNAVGQYATVPGGSNNSAEGSYSFAAGRRAKALVSGSFRWADGTNADFTGGEFADTTNSFAVRSTHGVVFYTNTALTSGTILHSGSSAWSSASDSCKKRNARAVDTQDVLNRLSQLTIKQWSYKAQDPSIEHIGPMAQDFWNAFHLGEDSLAISTIDPSGIALAGIQELVKRNDELENRIEYLENVLLQIGTNNQLNKVRKDDEKSSRAYNPCLATGATAAK